MAQLRQKQTAKTIGLCALGATTAVAGALWLPMLGASGMVVESSASSVTDTAQTLGAAETEQVSTSAHVVVHVDGAVMLPGVYELADGARVNDAIELAGGLTAEADTSTLNLAAKLADGQKVTVPLVGESTNSASSGEATLSADGSGSSAAAANTLVNINTASADELDTLPGVGPSTAATIIQDREESGPFTSIEDIMRISGIGEKKFAKIKDYICV